MEREGEGLEAAGWAAVALAATATEVGLEGLAGVGWAEMRGWEVEEMEAGVWATAATEVGQAAAAWDARGLHGARVGDAQNQLALVDRKPDQPALCECG